MIHPVDDRIGAPAPGAQASDLELLRRHEPILRFTQGEEFFPCSVETYVNASSLWLHRADGHDELVLAQDDLTIDRLPEPRSAEFGAVYYLQFIEPLNIAELTSYLLNTRARRRRDPGLAFKAHLGRLARVGYGSRILAALFSLTLLLRGRVPGEAAAAAALTAQQLGLGDEDRAPYYGRVVRSSGWIVLQYWFFYAFNNWRSGFYGANDHEADWEMIAIYLHERPDGEAAPEWIAYASHDFHGDDLRRHWSDREEVEVIDGHPVVYAGAGSHASYFRPGEYLTEIEVPYFTPIIRVLDVLRVVWVRILRQAGADAPIRRLPTFRIPFVDYARGDGRAIGPGQPRNWAPEVIEPAPAWVNQYRGLWGLYARDPLSGENAPSGPKFNRDGSVRQAWYDPAGWAGLDKVPTPTTAREILERRRAELAERQRALAAAIVADSAGLQSAAEELNALTGNAHLAGRARALETELRLVGGRLGRARQEQTENAAALEAVAQRLERVTRGQTDDPRGHIQRLMRPASPERLRLNRVVELWAAVNTGLMMIVLVGLSVFAHDYLALGVPIMIAIFALIEAIFRRQIADLIATVAVGLAIVAVLIAVYDYFWSIVVLLVLAAGCYLIWENIREVWG